MYFYILGGGKNNLEWGGGGGLMSSRFTLRTLPAFLAVHTFCAHAMVMATRA